MFNIQDTHTRQLLNTLRQMRQIVVLEQFFGFLQDFLQSIDSTTISAEVTDDSLALYHKGIELLRLEQRTSEQANPILEIDVLQIAEGISRPYAGSAATPRGYNRHSFHAETFCRSMTLQQKRLTGIEKLLQDPHALAQPITFEQNSALLKAALDKAFRAKLMEYLRSDAPYIPLIQSLLPPILLQSDIIEIAEASDFYFTQAKNCWQQILDFEESSIFYERVLNVYQHFNGRYDEFVAALLPDSPERKLCELLGEFVSYVDSKAIGKQTWNKYEDKRSLASAGLRQQHWITQLLRYKQSGGQAQGLSANARNAIDYIESPQTGISILSEKHRQQVSELLLSKKYENTSFVADLSGFFQHFDLQVKNRDNETHLISCLLYHPAISELWQKKAQPIVYESNFESDYVEDVLVEYELMPARLRQPLNQILYGPPGTGKTYQSVRLALSIVEGLPEAVLEQSGTHRLQKQFEAHCHSGTIAMLSFHQSMSYEDFIEGLKPLSEKGQLQYELQDGILKEIALRAAENPIQPHVLIIDEINRGNVAGIFGELISLLEEDKRSGAANALQLRLPYSKTMFCLPPNLYLIGTMNTTDRSIEALDAALRRRFSFRALLPRPDLLPKILLSDEANTEIDLNALLKTINQRLELLLDANHCIGHAYLWELDSLASLNDAFETRIIPLLEEYFYGNLGKIGLVLGKGFVEELPRANTRFADFSLADKEDFYYKPIYRLKLFPRSTSDYKAIYK